jgi:hypothetical protein
METLKIVCTCLFSFYFFILCEHDGSIHNDDKKQNFGQTQKQLEPEYNTSLKDPGTYFDVNADSKVIGTIMEHLTDYLARYDKQLDKQIQRFYSEIDVKVCSGIF